MPNETLAISEEHRQELAGLRVKTGEPIYSTVTYATTGNAAKTHFFVGTSDKNVGNVSKARELPDKHLMVVEEIRISAEPEAVVADVQEFLADAVLEFAPNEDARSRYFPLDILGAGGGPYTPTTTVATIGVPQQNAAFRLRIPEVIRGASPFVCNIQHPAAITPSAELKIRVILVGIYAYPAAKTAE